MYRCQSATDGGQYGHLPGGAVDPVDIGYELYSERFALSPEEKTGQYRRDTVPGGADPAGRSYANLF